MQLQAATALQRQRVLIWLGWPALLVVAWLSYLPGLTGGFLFDDFVNLNSLGATGPVDDAATFWRYITSGSADPTGRPLALLSFLIDARDWPADPASFLRTNLLLHLLNATLLFALLRKLGAFLGSDALRNDAAALLGAGLWLLHPLFVSTTLYVVQREAMLPASFILLALLAYSHGRRRYAQTQGTKGLLWMASSLVLGTALATLSKANGMLLPLLAWVLEATVFQADRDTPLAAGARLRLTRFKAVFLFLPSLLVLAYLARHLLLWDTPLSSRPWTIGERALTEPRILFDYLNLLVVPRSVSTGLYNDDYVLSQSLWNPGSTLPMVLMLAGLVGLAFYLRRRAPALSAGLLFFLAGHLLESTVIPLELYFEHRNYLPALLLFWPLSRAIVNANRPLVLRLALAGGALALCALTTYQRATIWGQPAQLAALWASRNPDSSRAQATAAMDDMQNGRSQRALDRLEPLWQQRPNDLQIALNYINAVCASRELSREESDRLVQTFLHANKGSLLVREWLERALYAAGEGSCRGLTVATVESWIDAARRNPAITTPSVREKSMTTLLAILALEKREPDKALAYFDRALQANVSPDVASGQASILATYGHYRQALKHLDTYERMKKPAKPHFTGMHYVHEKVLSWQGYWPRELAILRDKLEAELANEKLQNGKSD